MWNASPFVADVSLVFTSILSDVPYPWQRLVATLLYNLQVAYLQCDSMMANQVVESTSHYSLNRPGTMVGIVWFVADTC